MKYTAHYIFYICFTLFVVCYVHYATISFILLYANRLHELFKLSNFEKQNFIVLINSMFFYL